MTGFGEPREIVRGLRTVPTEMGTWSTFDCRGNQGWVLTSSKLKGSDRQQDKRLTRRGYTKDTTIETE